MQIECPNCKTGYEINDTALDNGGKNMVCSRCGHKWFQTLEDLQATISATEANDDEVDTSSLLDSIDDAIEESTEKDSNEDGEIEDTNEFNPLPPEIDEENSEDEVDNGRTENPIKDNENNKKETSSNNDTIAKEKASPNEKEFSAIGAASSSIPPIGSKDDIDSISIDAALSEGAEIPIPPTPEEIGIEEKEADSDVENDDIEPKNKKSNTEKEKKSKAKLKDVKGKIKELTEEQKQAIRKYMIATGAIVLFITIIATGFTENSHRIPVVGPVYELLGMSEEIPGIGLEFNNVRTIIIQEDGTEYIEVKGYILNTTKHTIEIPLIMLEIYDKSAHLIKETKVAPLKDKLAPGVNVNFTIREVKPTDAVRISVTFAPLPDDAKKSSKSKEEISTEQINIKEKATEEPTKTSVKEKTEQISK